MGFGIRPDHTPAAQVSECFWLDGAVEQGQEAQDSCKRESRDWAVMMLGKQSRRRKSQGFGVIDGSCVSSRRNSRFVEANGTGERPWRDS
jgi:hypothetical protein